MRVFFVFIMFYFGAPAKAHDAAILKHPSFEFRHIFGTFDRSALQRGFQVYKEVCATCHSLKRIRYRNLKALGFTEAQIKAIASQYEILDGPNTEGQMFKRKALSSDSIPSPYANDNAARATNNGALPPDLSLIVKARNGGADYIYSLLTGYTQPPQGVIVDAERHYNAYFPGNFISMAPPLVENQITYADGTPATVDQMAKDVATFLAWCAEPEMEQRKQTGVKIILYLFFMTILFYATKRRIWQSIRPPE